MEKLWFNPTPTEAGAWDHSTCSHPRTPKGRDACRAEMQRRASDELPLRVVVGSDGGVVLTCVKDHGERDADGAPVPCGIRWPVTSMGGQARIRQAVAHAQGVKFDDSREVLATVAALADPR